MNLTVRELFEMGESVVGKMVTPSRENDYGNWAFALTHKTFKTVSLQIGEEFEIRKPIKIYNEARGKRPASYYLFLKGKDDFYSMWFKIDEKTNLKFV